MLTRRIRADRYKRSRLARLRLELSVSGLWITPAKFANMRHVKPLESPPWVRPEHHEVNLLRPECCWIDPDESLILRYQDNPPAYYKITPPQHGFEIFVRSGWTDPGDKVTWTRSLSDPQVKLLKPKTGLSHLARGFIQKIPDDIKASAQKHPYMQLTVLQLAIRKPRARQLLSSDPLLLQMLAACLGCGDYGWGDVDRLLGLKLPKLLSALLGKAQPYGKTHIRFLRRLHYQEGNHAHLVSTVQNLQQPGLVETLRHWERIPELVLPRLQNSPAKEYCRLMRNATEAALSEGKKPDALLYRHLDNLWSHTLWMAKDLHNESTQAAINRYSNSLTNEGALDALHSRLIGIFDRKKGGQAIQDLLREEERKGNFPKPPRELMQNKALKPILRPRELFQEGSEMKHCVFAALREVLRAGGCWVFRYRGEQRGTVEIRLLENKYVVSEFKLKANALPSEKALSEIDAWLSGINKNR